eukprot:gene2962-5816_t
MSETNLEKPKTYERRRTVLPVAGKADCVNFNVMVVGETGSGKTTFLRTLVKADEAKATLTDIPVDTLKKTISIQEAGNFILESIAGDVKFILHDTPGYGDFINNQNTINQIFEDLQSRHESWLSVDAHKITNEERLRLDGRIHCCFYFISPHRFKDIDREFITKISDIVPIVPIISKSDQMTMEERAVFLAEVQAALINIANTKEMHIDDLLYDFQEAELFEVDQEGKALPQTIPKIPNVYAVVCEPKYERVYPWGTCSVKNEEHSDFIRLQKLVFEAGLHIKGLRDMTQRKTIDFLDSRAAYVALVETKERELQLEQDKQKGQEQRLIELEARVIQLSSALEDSNFKLQQHNDRSRVEINSLEEQMRIDREARMAAIAEAKTRAEEERKATDALLKTKEELHVANNHIAKLRSERDAEIRKAVAAATPPPLPSSSSPSNSNSSGMSSSMGSSMSSMGSMSHHSISPSGVPAPPPSPPMNSLNKAPMNPSTYVKR